MKSYHPWHFRTSRQEYYPLSRLIQVWHLDRSSSDGEDGDGEVESCIKGPLDCLDSLEEILPIKYVCVCVCGLKFTFLGIWSLLIVNWCFVVCCFIKMSTLLNWCWFGYYVFHHLGKLTYLLDNTNLESVCFLPWKKLVCR